MHHVSIRTANIHRAIAFYEILGFTVCERFTTGYTLACWMEGLNGRIELEPMQQMIGDRVYEVMFIADSDGLPLEFIRIL
ncbi:hypothetical protein L2E81_07060 [Planktothrix agardhii 1033]|nr:hypothetical protein [Planktothrix agardhii 1033]